MVMFRLCFLKFFKNILICGAKIFDNELSTNSFNFDRCFCCFRYSETLVIKSLMPFGIEESSLGCTALSPQDLSSVSVYCNSAGDLAKCTSKEYKIFNAYCHANTRSSMHSITKIQDFQRTVSRKNEIVNTQHHTNRRSSTLSFTRIQGRQHVRTIIASTQSTYKDYQHEVPRSIIILLSLQSTKNHHYIIINAKYQPLSST